MASLHPSLPRHDLCYTINSIPHQLTVYGVSRWGANTCLFDEEDNLIHRMSWAREGYTCLPLFSPAEFEELKNFATAFVLQKIAHPPTAFTLEKYHETINADHLHHAVTGKNNLCASINRLPCLQHIQSRLGEYFSRPLQAVNPHTGIGEFSIRLVRPFRLDYNPPHKDVWIGRLRRGINLYIPLAGSDEHSSLALLPQSHLWQESVFQYTQGGAQTDAYPFSVPGLLGLKSAPLAMLRPNPACGQALIFSPYMVHGGASNRNPHTTRASLEIRFWEKH